MESRCPGQDGRNIKAFLIKCPYCNYEVEIFSDEIRVKCPSCKNFVYREKLPSCIDWCKSAKKCIGEERYNDYIRHKNPGDSDSKNLP